jgi:hypothetical protein
MKKLLLAILLALPLMTAAVPSQKNVPIPECFPCPEDNAPPAMR